MTAELPDNSQGHDKNKMQHVILLKMGKCNIAVGAILVVQYEYLVSLDMFLLERSPPTVFNHKVVLRLCSFISVCIFLHHPK